MIAFAADTRWYATQVIRAARAAAEGAARHQFESLAVVAAAAAAAQPTFGTPRQFLIVVNHPKHPTLCVRIRSVRQGIGGGDPRQNSAARTSRTHIITVYPKASTVVGPTHRIDQLVDLTLRQVLARTGRSDCYIYCLGGSMPAAV